MKNISKIKVQATLIEKGKYYVSGDDSTHTVYYATFEFSDGTRQMFDALSQKIYATLLEGNGVLSYEKKQRKHKFIEFDSTNALSSTQSFTTYKSTITINRRKKGTTFEVDVIIFAFFLLFFLYMFFTRPVDIFVLAAIIMFSILLSFFVILLVKRKKLESIPKQRMAAKIVKKEWSGNDEDWFGNQHYITFSLQSGKSRKRIPVQPDVYGVLKKGDTGILTFTEEKKNIMFIAFERNIKHQKIIKM